MAGSGGGGAAAGAAGSAGGGVQLEPTNDWIAVGLGGDHTCAIDSNGSLYCWGLGADGQLGTGSTDSQLLPALVGFDHDWLTIVGGRSHSCGLKRDGSVYCWGSIGGYVGDVTSIGPSPNRVGSDNDWQSIASNTGAHVCGLKQDHSLYCWGSNYLGQVGDGTRDERPTPVRVGADSDWQTVAAGLLHTCAIKMDGSLYCWGYNLDGELGVDFSQTPNAQGYSPLQVGTDKDWQSLSAGGFHTCAIKTTGALWCWGDDSYGQIGGATSNRQSNVPIQFDQATDWTRVVAGDAATCAMKTDHSVWCWGDITATAAPSSMIQWPDPKRVNGANWESVSSGGEHFCGIAYGSLYCWGSNGYGQVGDGTKPGKTSPNPVLTDVLYQSVAVGSDHTSAVSTAGALYCWGATGVGQTGGADQDPRFVPERIGTQSNWASVWAYDRSTCALTTQGALYCWGDDTVINGNVDQTPARIGSDSDWASIRTESVHSCGIKTDHSLFCWGSGYLGDLGDGSSNDFRVPTRIGSDRDWQSVALGIFRTYGLKLDGSLYQWGSGYDDTDIPVSVTPSRLGTDSDWASLSANSTHACAIKTSGALYCWGYNADGELGNGTLTDSATPVQVGVDTDWQSVSAGGRYTCAVKTTGSLYCWGNDDESQLGDGTTMTTSTPLRIGTDSDWLSVAESEDASSTCALKMGGKLYCWGSEDSGQLGDGDGWKPTPTLITAR
jgi:alpha-tubulin suppressor-like RCC1 family protein